ncbi:FAD-dependent oxidoreductase [Sediminitomix flava]|uniref:FAD dependent oxidoreductase n=1 Tax=Sediminitomix flava TaxID=379075 RepID=A0A315ZE20_SEDFL|nr:FAD-dependent oxidoreductase [Sediminitomix flava]PWJ43815.1 FAD dependent oxidoreductase [Sediminitomix flava]
MYDIIINKATLNGVALALEKANLGESVLVINQYGFCGGSMTENFALLTLKDISEAELALVDEMKKERGAVLFESEEDIFFNPETVKSFLLKKLQHSNISLLFHASPFNIEMEEGGVKISVMTKDGKRTIEGKKLVDTSETKDLEKVNGEYQKVLSYSIHPILTGGLNSYDLQTAKVLKSKELNDGRVWIDLNFEANTLSEAEVKAHHVMTELTKQLNKENKRIQLAPTASQKII